jgi:hypothetical protein
LNTRYAAGLGLTDFSVLGLADDESPLDELDDVSLEAAPFPPLSLDDEEFGEAAEPSVASLLAAPALLA